ncbi:hypothetical protein ABWU59_05550 [Priestia megaterium]|nr:hypothetical protein [Priestia megaterium]
MQAMDDYMETHDMIIISHNYTLDEIDLDTQIRTVPSNVST